MASKRMRNLTTMTTNELQNLFASIVMAVDDDSFAEAKKVFLAQLFRTVPVTTVSHPSYQAITADSFYNSYATQAERGIVKLATTGEVNAGTTTTALTPGNIAQIQTNLNYNMFTQNGAPVYAYHRNAASLLGGGAMAWQATWKGDLPLNTEIQMNPTLDTGVELDNGYVMLAIKSQTDTERVMLDYNYSTGEFVRYIGNNFYLNISTDKRRLFLKARNISHTNVRIALTCNFTTR
jgi:hypothetical protein